MKLNNYYKFLEKFEYTNDKNKKGEDYFYIETIREDKNVIATNSLFGDDLEITDNIYLQLQLLLTEDDDNKIIAYMECFEKDFQDAKGELLENFYSIPNEKDRIHFLSFLFKDFLEISWKYFCSERIIGYPIACFYIYSANAFLDYFDKCGYFISAWVDFYKEITQGYNIFLDMDCLFKDDSWKYYREDIYVFNIIDLFRVENIESEYDKKGIDIELPSNDILINRCSQIYSKANGYMFETNNENVLFKLITGTQFEEGESFEWILTREISDRLQNKAYRGRPTVIDLCLFMLYVLDDFQNHKYHRNNNQRIINLVAGRVKLNGQYIEKESPKAMRNSSQTVASYHITNARRNKEKDNIIQSLFENLTILKAKDNN